MKTRFPLFAALTIVILWAAMLFAIPFVLDLFKDFKVEMPALTLMVLWVSRMPLGVSVLVCLTALLLALRQTAGWVCALILCIAWDVVFLGIAMPVFLLIGSLSGSATLPSHPTPFIALTGLVANQVLLGLLFANWPLFFAR